MNTPCREWTGYISTAGYGRTHVNGQKVYVHRLTWTQTYGPIPDGLWVLHRCDNRRCYEPTHLFLGTHEDNMRDMAAKKRSHSHGGLHGERNPAAKLTEEDVREIRRHYANGSTVGELQSLYGMSHFAIYRIVTGKGWRKVA